MLRALDVSRSNYILAAKAAESYIEILFYLFVDLTNLPKCNANVVNKISNHQKLLGSTNVLVTIFANAAIK